MDKSRFTSSGEDTPWISVSIQQNPPDYCNMHAGILYRDDDSRLHFLHLGWHKELRHEMYSGESACAIPKLDFADELFLSGFCELIWSARRKNEIPYNLKHDDRVVFNPTTGELSLPAGATGLNCSTFVAAVFRSASNDLIDDTDWPSRRPGDAEQQQEFINLLLSSKDKDRQAQGRLIQGEVGCPRIRPEELAGACLENLLPSRFRQCEKNGRFIRKSMEKSRRKSQGQSFSWLSHPAKAFKHLAKAIKAFFHPKTLDR